MSKKEIPLWAEWNIPFITKMNYLVQELPILSDDDVKDFWEEWKYTVYEAFRDADYWRDFKATIEIILEEEQS